MVWVAFGVAIVRTRPSLDLAWGRIRQLPLPAEGAAWLLFLPVLVGLRVWRTGWPLVARLAVITGLAGWNLLVLMPQTA